MKHTQFHGGLAQLEEEGAIQVLVAADGVRRDLVPAAIGELQFDVVVARLAGEYGVETAIERLPYVVARRVVGDPAAISRILWPDNGALRLRDREGRLVALFVSLRDLEFCAEKNPEIDFRPVTKAD